MKPLTLTEDLNVQYAVPLWLRDEQIRVNTAKVKKRIEPIFELQKEPIAAVSFGPSLNDTWEKIRDFKYVITCSGAHKFLLDRGIVPTWHIDVDPRKHKCLLLGQPHKDVKYLIASTCHPKLIESLSDYDLSLWHIFDSKAEGIRVLPPGEWAILGGCSAGLRTLAMARFFGFTDIHVFGMDGCDGPSGKHAAEHPNQSKDRRPIEYGGKTYWTISSMLEAAKQTWHELDQMSDVHCTFYGEGLVQAMAKDYVRKPAIAGSPEVAFQKPELISPEYCQLNRKLHDDNLAYGVGGSRHAKVVARLAEKFKTQSVLDYGCGKGYLAKNLDFPIWEYDPAIPGKDHSPRPADIVVCTDVLEHIELEKLPLVVADIHRCTKLLLYAVINSGPSTKTLADGRNTHLIQQDANWWRAILGTLFDIPENAITVSGHLVRICANPKAIKFQNRIGYNA